MTHPAFWVSPDGNDGNPGSQSEPFATLERAKMAVRTALQVGGGNVTVNIEPGTYRLAAPLALGPSDSAADGFVVTWRTAPDAAQGQRAEIVGSQPVEGWTRAHPTWPIFMASVPANAASRQLYVNGQRATRARTEDNPVGFRPWPTSASGFSQPAKIGGGIAYVVTDQNPSNWRNPANWGDNSGVEAVLTSQWRMMRVPMRAAKSGLPTPAIVMEMEQPAWTNANLYLGTSGTPGIWSFWQVTWFENSLAFLDTPGEWFLDEVSDTLYYYPPSGSMTGVSVELPVAETLISASGSADQPVKNITFSNLAFKYATWNGPSGVDGYVADQGGFFVAGENGPGKLGWRKPNKTGHVEDVTPTPGNLQFEYARNIVIEDSLLTGLGGVAIAFGAGSRDNLIEANEITEIASAAIRLGGVSKADARPATGQAVSGNKVVGNVIRNTGRDYYDTPGIIVGFTKDTTIALNEIRGTPWSGIAIGWGWGLLDYPTFPGIPNANPNEWASYQSGIPFGGVPTINDNNVIEANDISDYLQKVWDGGAVYTTGQQGHSAATALKIRENVAHGRGLGGAVRAKGGGNTFYTDGGTRFVAVEGNASYDNPIGVVDLGPPPRPTDPLPYPKHPSDLNGVPYGGEMGGCQTRGDIVFRGNYWVEKPAPTKDLEEFLEEFVNDALKDDPLAILYAEEGFFDICPFLFNGQPYPQNLTFENEHWVSSPQYIPSAVRDRAGPRR